MSERLSRYHAARQHDGRGWMLVVLDAIGSSRATVLLVDLPEDAARVILDDLRAAEVLEPSYPIEQINADLREAGGDPDAIGKRGASLVQELLAKRRERAS